MNYLDPILQIVPNVFESFFKDNYYGMVGIVMLTLLGWRVMALTWSALIAMATVTWISSIAQLSLTEEFTWAPVLLAGSVIIFVTFYIVRWIHAE